MTDFEVCPIGTAARIVELEAALTKSRAETAAAYERAAEVAKWVAVDACDTPDEMRGAAMVECAILAAIPKGGEA